ncbi:MAG TPA: carboxypeptidase-like regulatory domain-containing protein [Nitrospirota bacterium]|nr:carboxypeptidase-like regulatory domain-containing protein [Nitrospirota bacterium]
MRIPITAILILLVLSSAAVSAPREGTVEGTLVPPDASAQVTASRKGGTVATVRAGGQGGKFRLKLAAGTYTITVSAPVSSFPIRLENVVVKPGETTVLPSVLIVPGSGKAVLSGRVIPPLRDSEVKLIHEGKERAAGRIDREGRYEFRDLPAGMYEVRATAPGHAQDVSPVTIPENQRVQQTAVLLPVVAVDGVDWAAGKIRAVGVGSRPANAVNAGSSRAMAQRAAIADAQRNLLRTIEQIRIDGARSVGTLMRKANVSERVRGFVKGYTVVSERELGDGRIEVILELPLTGPSGLSRYVTE